MSMEISDYFLFENLIEAMKTSQHYWWCDPHKPENNLTVYTFGDIFVVSGWPSGSGSFRYFGEVLCELGLEDRLTNALECMTPWDFSRNPNSQKSARKLYEEYRRSDHWQATRRQSLERAKYRCQICNTGEVQLDVHHRTYERLGAELPEDLFVLCHNCHQLYETNCRIPRIP